MFLALVLATSAVLAPQLPDWKPAVKAREFKFDTDHSGAINSIVAARKAGLDAEFVENPMGFGEGSFTIQKKGGPKLTVPGHSESTFVFHGDLLYFANFSPRANGCAVVAYDLTTGKKTWEKPLAGIGAVSHSKYFNRVAMALEKHPTENHYALVIVGWEGYGRYVEVLDLATGQQLAHKRYEAEK
jgi:hypothetical protein